MTLRQQFQALRTGMLLSHLYKGDATVPGVIASKLAKKAMSVNLVS